MQNDPRERSLLVLAYLYAETDEEHPATLREIMAHLQTRGIQAGRKTVAGDIALLADMGADVICRRSTQNRYFIGQRRFQLPELKLLVDAVQAAQFISPAKSGLLADKLSSLASVHQAGALDRRLYTGGPVKARREDIYYTVDLLHSAIRAEKRVRFQYRELTPGRQPALRHGGRVYDLSPYDLVWSGDRYYVFGYSEGHGKVVKFRVDRLEKPRLTDLPGMPRPADYDLASFFRQVFQMYDAEQHRVCLRCENSMMTELADRFGEAFETAPLDEGHFRAAVEVSVSPTFFAWVFTYAEKLRIEGPPEVLEAYRARLRLAGE